MPIHESSLPNTLDSDKQKNSESFGYSVLKSCYERWKSGYGSESWVVRKQRFDYNRSFSVGKQPMSEYKDIIDTEGQLSVINLQYTPNPIAIPFLNRLKDRYMQRVEKISCVSIDPFTQSKKEKAKNDALFKMKNKEAIMALQQESGVQLEDFKDTDPEDEQELDIEFGFNYKEREEVVMENLINLVFYDNKWSKVIKDRVFDDLINCGYAVTKTYIDPNGRIKIKFVKPDNFITSYSEWNDMRDWEWQGEVDYMTITDIRLKYPGKFSEQELFDLAREHSGMFNNALWTYNWSYVWLNAVARPYDSYRVQVCNLTYKTLYNLNYEKKLDRFGKEILDPAKELKEGKEYEKSKPYYVSYTGAYIINTDKVLEWGLSKNMIKPEKNLTEISSPYTVYMYNNNQMVNTPLIETMIPSIKMMQLLNLKTQNIIATIAPDGSNIDFAGLSDIDLGSGVGVVSPLQLYGIYLQTGNMYYKGVGDDGEERRQPPITPNNVNFSNKLQQLEAQWQSEYQKLVVIIGSNALDSGQISNQAVGKQVFQDARKQGESASNYIYNSYLNIMEPTAQKVQQLGWDILVYKKGGYEGYMAALGSDKVEYVRVESTDDFERAQFDVKIEAVLDDTAQAILQERINIALNNKEITLQDALQVEELSQTNVKYASYLLAARQKKREKQRMKEAQINSQSNTEAAIAAAKAKSDGEMQVIQLKNDLEKDRESEKLEAMKIEEITKYSSILKIELMKALFAQGKTIEQMPSMIFDGIGLVDKTNKQLLMEELAESEARAAEMEQQAAAEEEQMMMQQQQEQGMMQEEMGQGEEQMAMGEEQMMEGEEEQMM
jgi:hypothetical protein